MKEDDREHYLNNMNESEIEELLGRLQPKPGAGFYKRMATAPWKYKPVNLQRNILVRLGAPLSIALILVVAFNFMSSNLRPTSTPTNTSSATMTTTIVATPGGTAAADENVPQSPVPTGVPEPPEETSSAYLPAGLQDSFRLT